MFGSHEFTEFQGSMTLILLGIWIVVVRPWLSEDMGELQYILLSVWSVALGTLQFFSLLFDNYPLRRVGLMVASMTWISVMIGSLNSKYSVGAPIFFVMAFSASIRYAHIHGVGRGTDRIDRVT